MALQPTAPSPQPPPEIPGMPDVSTTLTNYLRTFSLWCRNMFNDKLNANTALPGIMLQATDQSVANPPTYMLGVTSAGAATLATVKLGTGAPNAPGLGTPMPIGSVGRTDGSNAPAGQIGEYVTASAVGPSLVNNTPTNIISMPLTAGDWDVEGVAQLIFSASVGSAVVVGVSTVSATFPAGAQPGRIQLNASATLNVFGQSTGTMRVNSGAPITVYLVALAFFGSGTCTTTGFLRARRV